MAGSTQGSNRIEPAMCATPTPDSPSPASSLLSEALSGVKSKAPRGPRPRLFHKNTCQADGCRADLSRLPWYNRRNHICSTHKAADAFVRLGKVVRFCQRCGVAHAVPDFEGTKKSCRKKLEKHNAKRRKASSSTSVGLCPTPSPDAPPAHPLAQQLAQRVVLAADQHTTPATSSNERICCAGAGDECVCGACADAVAPSALGAAPVGAADRQQPSLGAAPHAPADGLRLGGDAGDDPNAHAADDVSDDAALQLDALQEQNAALYAAVLQHQLMQAQVLLATAGLVLHTLPALPRDLNVRA